MCLPTIGRVARFRFVRSPDEFGLQAADVLCHLVYSALRQAVGIVDPTTEFKVKLLSDVMPNFTIDNDLIAVSFPQDSAHRAARPFAGLEQFRRVEESWAVFGDAVSVGDGERRASVTTIDWWTVSLTTGLAALLLLALPGRQKRVRAALGFGLACVLCLVLGCGGGAGGTVGGPPPPPPPPGPTSVTLTTTSAKSPWGQSFTITATVTATKPLTGSIVFYDLGNQISSFGLTNGQAQIGWGYITNLGIHQITASYTGDSNNLASTTSAPLTQIITGTTTVGFFGATGGDFHSIPVTIGVQ